MKKLALIVTVFIVMAVLSMPLTALAGGEQDVTRTFQETETPPTTTKDSTNKNTAATTNKGDDSKLEIKTKYKEGAPGDQETSRGVLGFDISTIPSGSTVTGATLSLYLLEAPKVPAEGDEFSVYRLTQTDWVEMEVTWNEYKDGEAWTGGAISPSPTVLP